MLWRNYATKLPAVSAMKFVGQDLSVNAHLVRLAIHRSGFVILIMGTIIFAQLGDAGLTIKYVHRDTCGLRIGRGTGVVARVCESGP